MFYWYAKLLVNHPCKIISCIVFLCSCSILIPYYSGHVPQIIHPDKGFETRGTDIANRVVAWDNLIKTLELGVDLIDDIRKISNIVLPPNYKNLNMPINDTAGKGNSSHNKEIISKDSKKSRPYLQVLDKGSFEDSNEILKFPKEKDSQKNKMDFFCSKPTYDHARIVFTLNFGEDLLSFQAVKDMCTIQQRLEDLGPYKIACDEKDHKCCPPWSLVNYITLLRNHKSCTEIQPIDVNVTMTTLQQCAGYYHDNELLEWATGLKSIPHECLQYNAIYNLMHYHLDTNFMQPNVPANPLKSSMVFLPFEKGSIVNVYKAIQETNLSTPLVSISAIDFGINKKVFDLEVVEDIHLIIFSAVFIVVCVLVYTWSLILTIAAMLNIIFSISISYFIYTFIFQIQLFSFLNVLTILVLIGITTNSVFIVADIWKAIQNNGQADSLVDVVAKTIRQSAMFLLLSSLTSFFALATSYFSTVNGISCFGIFSATAVFVNFLITMSLFPACTVLLSSKHRPHIVMYEIRPVNKLLRMQLKLHKIQISFHSWLLKMMYRFHRTSLLVLSTAGVVSMAIIWIWPSIKLAESTEFQLFKENHPFEQYDLIYKNQFWFERILKIDTNPKNPVPLRFVWGVIPKDTGDKLDPDDRGDIVYDPDFDMAHPKSQVWLLQFCSRLRIQPFCGAIGGPQLTNCFIETFVEWMSRPCTDDVDQNLWPCCNAFEFPFPRNVFNFCIIKSMHIVYNSPSAVFVPSTAGPKFSNLLLYPSNQTLLPLIKTVVVEFDSSFDFTTSYEKMDKFYTQVESWSIKMMDSAPPGLRNGWFYSHLGYYDLQKMLYKDTLNSIIFSFALGFCTLMLATNSLSLTVMTMITMFLTTCTTVAVLVLLGWRLNVLESIATTIAISLSMSYSQHYTIEYQTASKDSPRATAVARALSLVACPSFMGALTTGISGFFVLFSNVLPYVYLGMFVITIMCINWVFSTFFLVPLLSAFGSAYEHGPYPYHCCEQLSKNHNVSIRYRHCTRQSSLNSNVGSDSGSSNLNQINAHEMETLTVQSLRSQSPNFANTTSGIYLSSENINDDGNGLQDLNTIHI